MADVCMTCLSQDRSLKALSCMTEAQTLEWLYKDFLPCSSMLCWECVAELRRIYRFRHRAQKAKDALLLKAPNSSLSTLTTVNTTKLHKYYVHTKTEIADNFDLDHTKKDTEINLLSIEDNFKDTDGCEYTASNFGTDFHTNETCHSNEVKMEPEIDIDSSKNNIEDTPSCENSVSNLKRDFHTNETIFLANETDLINEVKMEPEIHIHMTENNFEDTHSCENSASNVKTDLHSNETKFYTNETDQTTKVKSETYIDIDSTDNNFGDTNSFENSASNFITDFHTNETDHTNKVKMEPYINIDITENNFEDSASYKKSASNFNTSEINSQTNETDTNLDVIIEPEDIFGKLQQIITNITKETQSRKPTHGANFENQIVSKIFAKNPENVTKIVDTYSDADLNRKTTFVNCGDSHPKVILYKSSTSMTNSPKTLANPPNGPRVFSSPSDYPRMYASLSNNTRIHAGPSNNARIYASPNFFNSSTIDQRIEKTRPKLTIIGTKASNDPCSGYNTTSNTPKFDMNPTKLNLTEILQNKLNLTVGLNVPNCPNTSNKIINNRNDSKLTENLQNKLDLKDRNISTKINNNSKVKSSKVGSGGTTPTIGTYPTNLGLPYEALQHIYEWDTTNMKVPNATVPNEKGLKGPNVKVRNVPGSNATVPNEKATVYVSVCEICGRPLWNNALSVHPHLRSHTPIEERKVQCPKCLKSFVFLKRHQVNCRGPVIEETSEQKEKDCICPHCTRRLCNKATLRKHIRVVHDKMYTMFCDICGMGTANKSHMRKHMQQKHNADPFTPKQRVKDHLCPYCGKTYYDKGTLKSHIRTHTEKSFHCAHCEWKFSVRSTLVTHLWLKHPQYINKNVVKRSTYTKNTGVKRIRKKIDKKPR